MGLHTVYIRRRTKDAFCLSLVCHQDSRQSRTERKGRQWEWCKHERRGRCLSTGGDASEGVGRRQEGRGGRWSWWWMEELKEGGTSE